MEKSAILEHAWNYHQVDWDEVMVLAEKTPHTTRKEAFHIHLTDTEKLINRDEDVAISGC